MTSQIAFFDFDGTITTRDTLPEFIKYYRGTVRCYLGFLLYSPFLIAYKVGLIPNYVAKEKILQHFFQHETMETFNERCSRFSREILPALIRPKAMQEISRLKAMGVTMVVVSASPENWITDWATLHRLDLIATRLATENNRLTGSISGSNCYGQEKVNRIRSRYALEQYEAVYCYGDTSGDKPMLALGSVRFYKPFR